MILSDTDHYSPMGSHALWAWKTFLRGHHPVLYDLGIFGGVRRIRRPVHRRTSRSSRHASRWETRCAVPSGCVSANGTAGELASTGYALVNPGVEYLVLQPDEDADHVEIELPAGTYRAHWFGLERREWTDARAGDGRGRKRRRCFRPRSGRAPASCT